MALMPSSAADEAPHTHVCPVGDAYHPHHPVRTARHDIPVISSRPHASPARLAPPRGLRSRAARTQGRIGSGDKPKPFIAEAAQPEIAQPEAAQAHKERASSQTDGTRE